MKRAKKLHVSVETVRILKDAQLGRVPGGKAANDTDTIGTGTISKASCAQNITCGAGGCALG